MPFFAAPLAFLLGAATVPALFALYFLRNRRRKIPVSSLMLWTVRREESLRGARFQRLRLPLLFLLELLILLLLTLAATGVQWTGSKQVRPLVVLLDNSFSMQARDNDGRDARARALEKLAEIRQAESFSPLVIATVGEHTRRLDSNAVTALLKKNDFSHWPAYDTRANWSAAYNWALTQGWRDAALLVLSDQPPTEKIPAGVRWLAVGKASPNLSFVQASRSNNRLLLGVWNSSAVAVTAPLRIRIGEREISRLLQLRPGQQKRLTLPLEKRGLRIHAELPVDSLLPDNTVDLLPEPEEKVRVRIDLEEGASREAIEEAINACGLRDPSPGTPDLWIGKAAAQAPPNARQAWQLRLHTPPEGDRAAAVLGPFALDRSAPLLQGLRFDYILWLHGKKPLPGTPLVATGQAALLSQAKTLGGHPRFDIYLDAKRSTLPRSPDWPILFWNLLSHCASQNEGIRPVNSRPGIFPELRTRESQAVLQRQDGSQQLLTLLPETTPLPQQKPGIYTVTCGTKQYAFAYNLLVAEESNLQKAESSDSGDWDPTETMRRAVRQATPGLLLAALLLLVFHQLLIRRGMQR